MSSYSSVSAYRLAVRLRTNKTLLVEGVSDKKILSHFILKRNYADRNLMGCCIDDVSFVDDKSLGPIGAREKVINIAAGLISDNFRCLIDREWDGFDQVSLEYDAAVFPENMFVTRGHSIENYWFTPGSFIEFLIYTHNAVIGPDFLNKIELYYIAILQFSAAYSLACRSLSVVSRANEMLSHESIVFDDFYFSANACLDEKIAGRGHRCELYETTNRLLAHTKLFDQDKLQWICHGHLGEQAIRACIGRLAHAEGYDASTIESIEYGFKIEKLKLDSDHVTKLPEYIATPLNKVLKWVRSDE
ncbi:DUF4435 domain-containing protein [Pseudomonas syringae]|uniref:DUF4435 domain-containing protein n=1 Tax=Pseudomonas syringae TaxID=317 RepID=UPI0004673EA9|nr:DUF4435 domain-containing protein [Pseudomonas syringae]